MIRAIKVKGESFVIRNKPPSATLEFMLMNDFRKASKDGDWLPGEPTQIRGLEFSAPPPNLWIGERNWRQSSATKGR